MNLTGRILLIFK